MGRDPRQRRRPERGGGRGAQPGDGVDGGDGGGEGGVRGDGGGRAGAVRGRLGEGGRLVVRAKVWIVVFLLCVFIWGWCGSGSRLANEKMFQCCVVMLKQTNLTGWLVN